MCVRTDAHGTLPHILQFHARPYGRMWNYYSPPVVPCASLRKHVEHHQPTCICASVCMFVLCCLVFLSVALSVSLWLQRHSAICLQSSACDRPPSCGYNRFPSCCMHANLAVYFPASGRLPTCGVPKAGSSILPHIHHNASGRLPSCRDCGCLPSCPQKTTSAAVVFLASVCTRIRPCIRTSLRPSRRRQPSPKVTTPEHLTA